MDAVNLPAPCVVVLVGPGASGKTTWADEHFAADVIVSSDRLRALVGSGEDDIAASADAFELLDDVVRRRLARRLTTVIDTLGLDAERRTAVARAGPAARAAVCGGRVRHPGRGVPGPQPRSRQADPGRRTDHAAQDLGGGPRRSGR